MSYDVVFFDEADDIDRALREMWDRYALPPQTIWVDGCAYERAVEKIVIHWDPRNGWAMGSKP
ncbi:hypothetical protein [Paraburkholderia sacchari]|uniref:hypothetical protein n=1 Tax=Paraburkholderia sacchari TaxID=159450 RepID=UPI001BD0CF81|nr:hypothetical protein [Paraburkholderia sacchari]